MTDNPFRSGLNDSPSLYRVPGSNGLVMAPYRVNREGSAGGLLQQHHTIPNNIFGSGVLELEKFWQQMERLGYDQRDPATNRVWTTTDPVEAVRTNTPLLCY